MEEKRTPEVIKEEEQVYPFEETLNTLYEEFQTLDHQVKEDLDTKLKELLTHTEEELNTLEYMRLLYMEGCKYEQQGNKNAARFCAMRMLHIRECYENPKRKRPRFLNMIPYTISEDMNAFIDRYTDFLADTYRLIARRLLIITAGLAAIIILIFIILLRLPVWISLMNAILIALLNYILQKRRLPAMFQKNQTDAIEHYVEEDVLDFDRPVRYS